jgi:hypothetical protein
VFIQERDRKLDSTWDGLHLKRDEIPQVLGTPPQPGHRPTLTPRAIAAASVSKAGFWPTGHSRAPSIIATTTPRAGSRRQ